MAWSARSPRYARCLDAVRLSASSPRVPWKYASCSTADIRTATGSTSQLILGRSGSCISATGHGGLGGVFKSAILQPDVGNGSVLEAANRPRVGSLADLQIQYFDVAHHRRELTFLAFLVGEIDFDGRGRHLPAL